MQVKNKLPPAYTKVDCGYKTETKVVKQGNYVKVIDLKDGQVLATKSLKTGKVRGITEYFHLLDAYEAADNDFVPQDIGVGNQMECSCKETYRCSCTELDTGEDG
jgi:hypothetical protein